MGDVNDYGEGLGSGSRARVRGRYLARSIGSIVLPFDFRSRFNVRVRASLRFSMTIRCG